MLSCHRDGKKHVDFCEPHEKNVKRGSFRPLGFFGRCVWRPVVGAANRFSVFRTREEHRRRHSNIVGTHVREKLWMRWYQSSMVRGRLGAPLGSFFFIKVARPPAFDAMVHRARIVVSFLDAPSILDLRHSVRILTWLPMRLWLRSRYVRVLFVFMCFTKLDALGLKKKD